ncbi:DMT family transporter [Deinococcus altitudinis]|uniref:DMT family transporter n=1 Tax=Deinococcus altitudinis TaxID=468914 RepID=UPI0038929F98
MAVHPLFPVAVLVGALLPVQFALNSALTSFTHSPTTTASVSYGVGLLALVLGLALVHRGRIPLHRLQGAPSWSFLGGVVGSAYVIGSVVLTRLLGTGLAVSLVIAAQVVAGLALDHFGAFGTMRRLMNRTRTLALVLVLAALGLQVL